MSQHAAEPSPDHDPAREHRRGDEPHADEASAEAPVAAGPLQDEPASEEAREEGARATKGSPAHAALEALEKEELIDRHLRLVADLRRVRQRAVEEQADARRDERERVLLSLFDVIDNLERGLLAERELAQDAAAGRQDAADPWRAGVEGIHKQMLDVVARYGVTAFSPAGEPFNAHEQEALCTTKDPEKADGVVAYVERKGYRAGARVLRPARVVVVQNG